MNSYTEKNKPDIPCIIYEDDHLLVVNKPAGWNTHSPDPHAGEGIYEWLRNHDPRWSGLAIVHRLDKETSGVLVFSKTKEASKSLTDQFSEKLVHKQYLLGTDHEGTQKPCTIESRLIRKGKVYTSSDSSRGRKALTHFKDKSTHGGIHFLTAEPETGRSHQIRAHAGEGGFPILGDTLYGGTPAGRIYLHAESISIQHPATNARVTFSAPVDFSEDKSLALRKAFINTTETNAYRVIHGAADNYPGLYADRLGQYLLAQGTADLSQEHHRLLKKILSHYSLEGAYFKQLNKQVAASTASESSPRNLYSEKQCHAFTITENGIRYRMSFSSGYSVGLFLDQRDNRRRFLTASIGPDFEMGLDPAKEMKVLNTFAYTCGYSVCAAKAGARTTSIDSSKKNLEWGKSNFELNGIPAESHDFIFGDVFNWLKRLNKKNRLFDIIILDPPTFSRSKDTGVFKVEKNYSDLVSLALPLLKPKGVLMASANTSRLQSDDFLKMVKKGIQQANRSVLQFQYIPQPPDFPVKREEPAHLKTVWLRIE